MKRITKNTKGFFKCEECNMIFKSLKEAGECEKRHMAGNEECHGGMIRSSLKS